jgi:hypothetical protein
VTAKEDKRGPTRAKRRILVRFGEAKTDRSAFTRNLSETGIFIQTNSISRPGTTIQVELSFPDRSFSMWGEVMWAKKVPPQLAHILDCGMGIRFVDPTPEWRAFYAEWARKVAKI